MRIALLKMMHLDATKDYFNGLLHSIRVLSYCAVSMFTIFLIITYYFGFDNKWVNICTYFFVVTIWMGILWVTIESFYQLPFSKSFLRSLLFIFFVLSAYVYEVAYSHAGLLVYEILGYQMDNFPVSSVLINLDLFVYKSMYIIFMPIFLVAIIICFYANFFAKAGKRVFIILSVMVIFSIMMTTAFISKHFYDNRDNIILKTIVASDFSSSPKLLSRCNLIINDKTVILKDGNVLVYRQSAAIGDKLFIAKDCYNGILSNDLAQLASLDDENDSKD